MRFLVDAHLSPRVAGPLNDRGHSVTYVTEIGLLSANDPTIFKYAASGDSVIISADADFDALLPVGKLVKLSFVLLPSAGHFAPDVQVELVPTNLESLAVKLGRGAIVTSAHGEFRVRSFPVSE